MSRFANWIKSQRSSFALAVQALQAWRFPQWFVAAIASVAVGLIVGLATVLIPNPIFARDIPPVAWNYPVWIVTSILMGMLIATYVRPLSGVTARGAVAESAADPGDGASTEQRSARVGTAAGVLAWFAVGCPVCNKFALIALGYAGALTWFAPFQPVLAVAALVLSAAALVWRLRGQVVCPAPARSEMPTP